MTEPAIKGSLVAANKDFILKTQGADALRRVIAAMPQADGALIAEDLLKGAWFSERVFIEFMNTAERVLGNGSFTLSREMGRHGAHSTVATIYKVFMRLGNPGYVIQKSGSFWRQVHTHGLLEMENTSANSVRTRLVDYPYPSQAFCESLLGFFTGTMQLCGCKGILFSHPQCRGRGDGLCEFLGTWL